MATGQNSPSIRGRYHEASDPPTIDADGVPSKCLSLTIAADWGHFRRIDRTVTKQTYRIPPRTTIAGLLAAIVGVGRDGYYDVFADDVSAIALEVARPIRTVAMPSLGLGTNPSETFERAGGTGQRTVQVQFPDSTDARQLHSYHYLVDPTYRIDVAMEDPAFYGTLKQRLETGTTYYSPSMGLSELLASVRYDGEYEPLRTDPDESPLKIDSALPDAVESVVPSEGRAFAVERVPGFMTDDDPHRHTTEFIDYTIVEDGSPIRSSNQEIEPVTVDGRTVVFR